MPLPPAKVYRGRAEVRATPACKSGDMFRSANNSAWSRVFSEIRATKIDALARSGHAEERGSQLSLPRVPVPFKIDNQLIAEMQERLLEGVCCQIPAQCV